jgi:hypothetical protein
VSVPRSPGTYHYPAELAAGDRIAMGANHDIAEVISVEAQPNDKVQIVLAVPAGSLFRLQK